MKQSFLFAVAFSYVISLDHAIASRFSPDQESGSFSQTSKPKPTLSVQDRVRMFEMLSHSSTQSTLSSSSSRSQFNQQEEPPSPGRVKKLSRFFQRSRSAGNLKEASQVSKKPAAPATMSSTETSPNLLKRLQRTVSSFSLSPKAFRAKTQKESNPDNISISRSILNQDSTKVEESDLRAPATKTSRSPKAFRARTQQKGNNPDNISGSSPTLNQDQTTEEEFDFHDLVQKVSRFLKAFGEIIQGGNNPDKVSVSSPTLNLERTKRQDLNPLDHIEIEEKLEEKIRHYNMLIATIDAHIERGTIDKNSEGYRLVLRPKLNQLAAVHIEALQYLTNKNSIKRRQKNYENVKGIVKNMGEMTTNLGEDIFCLTGNKQSYIFDQQIEDARKQLKGKEQEERLEDSNNQLSPNACVVNGSSTSNIMITHPLRRGTVGGDAKSTSPQAARARTQTDVSSSTPLRNNQPSLETPVVSSSSQKGMMNKHNH